MPPKGRTRAAARARTPSPPPTPVAKRSSAPLVVLRKPMCLRCSKNLAGGTNDGLPCNKGIKKCDYCAKGKHPCDPIPVEFVPILNDLIDLRQAVDYFIASVHEAGDQYEDAGEVLATRVREYTAQVELTKRATDKRGLKHVPTSNIEVGMLLVEEIGKLRGVLEGVLDVMRVAANLPAIVTEGVQLAPVWEDGFDTLAFVGRAEEMMCGMDVDEDEGVTDPAEFDEDEDDIPYA